MNRLGFGYFTRSACSQFLACPTRWWAWGLVPMMLVAFVIIYPISVVIDLTEIGFKDDPEDEDKRR